MRHLIPSMRQRRSGTIVNVTFMEALRTIPTLGICTASKTALQTLTFAVRQEVAGFGIRVLVVAPGAIRTDFNDAGILALISDAYKETASEHVQDMLLASGGKQTGDPKKMALRIVEVVDRNGLVKATVESGDGFESLGWMPLGSDIGSRVKENDSELKLKAEKLEGIWSSITIEDI